MAEERLIDDNRDKDKDRKYRFRINEDGEEELEIVEDPDNEPEEQTEQDVGGLEVPEFNEDDEEAAVMTPEQLFAERQKAENERAARENKARELIAGAEAARDEGKNSYALTLLDSAQKECPDLGEIYSLKLQILTDNFTSAARAEECLDVIDGYKEYASAEVKSEISKKFAPVVRDRLEEVERKNVQLKAENDEKKTQRRLFFAEGYKKALVRFFIALIPFIIFVGLGIGFSSVMYSDKGGVLFVLTIVFFAIAGVALIATMILGRLLAIAARKVSRNENDSATALGREYLAGKSAEDVLKKLYEGVREEKF